MYIKHTKPQKQPPQLAKKVSATHSQNNVATYVTQQLLATTDMHTLARLMGTTVRMLEAHVGVGTGLIIEMRHV